MKQFDMLFDILSNSRKVQKLDYEKETRTFKGMITFFYEDHFVSLIFNKQELEKIEIY